jgi:hypothetical protein
LAKDGIPRPIGTKGAPAPDAKGMARSKIVNLIFSFWVDLAEIFYFFWARPPKAPGLTTPRP